eukprot:scaffold2131_cov113-Isochrysis_galbana.AAC.14
MVRVLGLSKTIGLILASISDGGRSFARAILATTGGGGERNLHLVFRERWTIARGPSHTPFGGVRSLANTSRRCGANWAPPYNSNSYSHRVHRCMHAVHLCVVCVAMWTWPLSVGVLVVVCVLYARERENENNG